MALRDAVGPVGLVTGPTPSKIAPPAGAPSSPRRDEAPTRGPGCPSNPSSATPCRYAAADPWHICADRDGRIPPRDTCHDEARAQLRDARPVQRIGDGMRVRCHACVEWATHAADSHLPLCPEHAAEVDPCCVICDEPSPDDTYRDAPAHRLCAIDMLHDEADDNYDPSDR